MEGATMELFGLMLYVRDVDDSLKFYRGLLRMSLIRRPAPHLAILQLGGTRLYLHEDPEDAPAWLKSKLAERYRGHGVLPHIEVNDLVEIRDRLADEGVDISLGPVEQHGQIQLYVFDPDGYNIVLVQPQ